MRGFLAILTRFRRDERGVFAIIFAVCAIAIVALAGAVVDFTSVQQARTRAQVALDAAALALQPKINDASVTAEQIRAQAEALVIQQVGDSSIVAKVLSATPNKTDGTLTLAASIVVPTPFVSLVGVRTMTAGLESQATRGSLNIEVAVALDITGSMNAGTRMSDLRAAATELIGIVVQDAQTPTYSRMALVPYSMGVNVGSHATAVRGPIVPGSTVTGAGWKAANDVGISSVSRASQAVVTTTSNHGLVTGDIVYIQDVSNMWGLNDNYFTVTRLSNTQVRLNSTSTTGYSYNGSGGTITKCLVSTCEVVVNVSGTYSYPADSPVYLTGLNTTLPINNRTFTVRTMSSTALILRNQVGLSGSYTSGGMAYCAVRGCMYYNFSAWDGTNRTLPVSNCASERTTNAYTDAPPSTTYLGRVYNNTGSNPCPSRVIMPLSSTKSALEAHVAGLTAAGSTAGHLGLAWAWYMISPNFNSTLTGGYAAAAYEEPNLLKAVVLMTDGEFNTAFCNDVISRSSGSGSGNSYDKTNCDAPNGSSGSQALSICSAIKAKNVLLYTVGFEIAGNPTATTMLANCATGPEYAFSADSGADLKEVFKKIGQHLSSLRISK